MFNFAYQSLSTHINVDYSMTMFINESPRITNVYYSISMFINVYY